VSDVLLGTSLATYTTGFSREYIQFLKTPLLHKLQGQSKYEERAHKEAATIKFTYDSSLNEILNPTNRNKSMIIDEKKLLHK
jgi:hypothetical protein